MEQEVKEGVGVIETKEEAMSKKGKYWRYKIRMDGDEDAKYPTSFSMWEYEAGSKVNTGEHVKVFWEENPGKNAVGKDVTYRNIKSIGPVEKYKETGVPQVDPNPPNPDDAPKGTLKPIVQQEISGSEGTPTSFLDRESRRQRMIVRQSALNYATQLASVFATWRLGKGEDIKIEAIAQEIKAIAKEFESNVMRDEK